ncbi:hypothetical protein [Nocardioides pakistanensis]
MSRTDKTRPWDVKCLDDPSWLVEVHDHRNGVCDLPERPRRMTSPFGSTERGACTWAATREFWANRANGCGCSRCADQVGRKARARRVRHAARVEAEAERLAYVGFDDLADIDLFPAPDAAEDFSAVADALDLPSGAFVVGVDETHRYDIEGTVLATFTTVTVLHPGGTRDRHRYEVTRRQFLDDPTDIVRDHRDAALAEAGLPR